MQISEKLRTRAQISAHVLWDHFVRPVAQAHDDVPWSIHGLSNEWLTAVLGRGIPEAVVLSFELGSGNHGSTVRRQLYVQWNEAGKTAGLPEHLYTKSTPTVATRLLASYGALAEKNFFEKIRSELDIEAPQLVHSAHDFTSGRSLQIFDDLVATKGATFCDYTTSISRGQADEIVDILSVFHGQFYGSERFETDLKWLYAHEYFLMGFDLSGNRIGHNRAMIKAADVIPSEVQRRREEIWPQAIANLKLHDTEPRTLLHSDVHLGNWYITGTGHMGLCDWQVICTGHWARDVAYALSTILSVEQRRNWERELLARYLENMRERCGLSTTFDAAFRQYRQQLFSALLMWTPTLCHSPLFPEMQPLEMSRTMIHRITTAIDDLDALDIKEIP